MREVEYLRESVVLSVKSNTLQDLDDVLFGWLGFATQYS